MNLPVYPTFAKQILPNSGKYLIFCIVLSIFFTSCVAASLGSIRLLSLRGVTGLAAERALVTRIGARSAVARTASLARTAGLGLTIDEVAIINRSLPNLRLLRNGAKVEVGYLEGGKMQSIARILPSRNQIKFKSGEVLDVNKQIFAIRSNGSIIRSNSNIHGKEVARLEKDQFVIKLSEENGWYKVRYGQYKEGFINPEMLLFLCGADSDENGFVTSTSKSEEMYKLDHYIENKSSINKSNEFNVGLILDINLIDIQFEEKINTFITQLNSELETSNNVLLNIHFLNKDFYATEKKNKLFKQDLKDFKNEGLGKYTDNLLLIQLNPSFRTNQFENLLTCESTFNSIVLDADTGLMLDSKSFNIAGAGFNQAQSLGVMFDHIIQKIKIVPYLINKQQ